MSKLTKEVLLYFYSSTGVLQHVCDDFKSITFNRSWAGVGDATINLVNPKAENLTLIKNSMFVSINNDGFRTILITSVEEDYTGNKHNVVVNGTELKGLASKRIVMDCTTITDDAMSIMKTLINNNIKAPTDTARALGSFTQTFSTHGTVTTEDVDYDAKYGTLSNELKTLCESYELGYYCQAVISDNTITGFVWHISSGFNRTLDQTTREPMVISFEDNTVDDLSYSENIKSTVNTAIVGGQGEGVDRTIVVVNGTNSGLNRNEKFVEARAAESDELQDKGEQAIAEYGTDEITSIEPSVSMIADYLSGVFAIGDKGTVRDFNKTMTLTKVTEIYEKGYIWCKFDFGLQNNTIASAIGAITANYSSLLKQEGGSGSTPTVIRTRVATSSSPTISGTLQTGDVYFGTAAAKGYTSSITSGSTDLLTSGAAYTGLAAKQNTLTAGAGITISGNVISSTGTTYTAGTNIQISSDNVISATDTTYTAGAGISIINNQIINTEPASVWKVFSYDSTEKAKIPYDIYVDEGLVPVFLINGYYLLPTIGSYIGTSGSGYYFSYTQENVLYSMIYTFTYVPDEMNSYSSQQVYNTTYIPSTSTSSPVRLNKYFLRPGTTTQYPVYRKSVLFTDISASAAGYNTALLDSAWYLVGMDGYYYNSDGYIMPLNYYHSSAWRTHTRQGTGTYITFSSYVGSTLVSNGYTNLFLILDLLPK